MLFISSRSRVSGNRINNLPQSRIQSHACAATPRLLYLLYLYLYGYNKAELFVCLVVYLFVCLKAKFYGSTGPIDLFFGTYLGLGFYRFCMKAMFFNSAIGTHRHESCLCLRP